MHILVITRSSWSDNNSTGNTMSQFFSKFSDAKIYNLYFREEPPKNSVCSSAFCITEGQIVRSLFKKNSCGKYVNVSERDDQNAISENTVYSVSKKIPFLFPLFVREWLWSTRVWNNQNLKQFISEINPDIIFMPVFPCWYAHKVLAEISKMCSAKVVLFHADDVYSLKQLHISPLYWVYRFTLRKWVKNSVNISHLNYAISEFQKEEYERTFNCNFKLLTKFNNFDGAPCFKKCYNEPLQLIYTGNISLNRWKSLAKIACVLHRINSNGVKAQLKIYTGNTLTKKMKKALEIKDTSCIMGSVSGSEISSIQESADILVHVEALDLKNKLCVRLSFSTKIVDYMASSRAILVYGPKDVASIHHLVKNNCAIVADNEDDLYDMINRVVDDPKTLNSWVNNAFICGKKYHNETEIENMLKEDFLMLCSNSASIKK